jgi:hypothetical protein
MDSHAYPLFLSHTTSAKSLIRSCLNSITYSFQQQQREPNGKVSKTSWPCHRILMSRPTGQQPKPLPHPTRGPVRYSSSTRPHHYHAQELQDQRHRSQKHRRLCRHIKKRQKRAALPIRDKVPMVQASIAIMFSCKLPPRHGE